MPFPDVHAAEPGIPAVGASATQTHSLARRLGATVWGEDHPARVN